jgi:hypothetical protein
LPRLITYCEINTYHKLIFQSPSFELVLLYICYLGTTFKMPSSSYSLVIVIKPKGKRNCQLRFGVYRTQPYQEFHSIFYFENTFSTQYQDPTIKWCSHLSSSDCQHIGNVGDKK